uniref:Vomeronasal type-1 receptor n=1 Tax=Loxodonta africana TaxID=9785 RepID=G3UNN3_LOXAF
LPMSFQKQALRTNEQVTLKTFFLSKVVVETLASGSLFFHNVSPTLTGHRMRSTHTIFACALGNSLVLLSSRIPQMMAAFRLKNILSSLGCKLFYYICRLACSTTLCSTCILSTYQAITLIPVKAEWATVRGRAPKVIGPSCCTCWMFSVFTNIYTPFVTGPQGTYNDTTTQDKWMRSHLRVSAGIVAFWSATDTMFIGLMIGANGSMALLLCKHQQRVQHIHTPSHSHKHPTEIIATHNPDTGDHLWHLLIFYLSVFVYVRVGVMHVSQILASCFPTVSPLLLILRDPRVLCAIISHT